MDHIFAALDSSINTGRVQKLHIHEFNLRKIFLAESPNDLCELLGVLLVPD
jgi:hypothetical protein